ncbi:PTS transporter subunit EIIC [uncultured Subdoligranulum sp.]|uniref:PTS transporter subunit EIIC n=1 Tax=uncultured Subdoligranulum sp. TaxID=512298 RepID=UPI0025F6FF06|nr:PTS transporter subunit EIIC [uncultured Subdoligranulum sp.]
MSDKDKQQRYLAISKQITEQIGGKDNIVASTHCATRLRIVLKDYDKINKEGIDNIDLVKGEFVAGNQLQIIFGAGLVNEIYEVFSAYTGTAGSSMADVKQEAAKKMNPLQAVIKSLSDVFVDIMPGILAAALLSGLTGVLSQWDVVAGNATLFGINRLVSLASNGIFSILPLAVCYSACKRYGGKPILGLVMGAIMLDGSLANAYDAAQGLVQPDSISLFGLNIELVGFQGGIIIALMMGFIVAKLDIFFDKKIPDVVKLLFSPMCSVLISTVLLFTIVGPAGRLLSNGITNGLIWMTQNLGLLGYMVFGGVQQIIVITGLHHIFGAIEAQLLSDTGRNFLNPLMSVALMGQGGAVLGYLALNWKNNKVKELCIPSFISTLFGISEPAIFGVNLRYKFPLVAGCIGGAIAGGYVFLTNLASLGFGTTALPGLAICDPAGNGYINYIVAHLIALGVGLVLTVIFGKVTAKKGAAQ